MPNNQMDFIRDERNLMVNGMKVFRCHQREPIRGYTAMKRIIHIESPKILIPAYTERCLLEPTVCCSDQRSRGNAQYILILTAQDW